MKDYREMAQSVLERRDGYVIRRKKQIRTLAAAVPCLCLCALAGFGAWQGSAAGGGQAGTEQGAPVSEYSAGTEQKQPLRPAGEASATEVSPAPGGSVGVQSAPLSPDVGSTPLNAAADLTREALYSAVGSLLPARLPDGFAFESASFSEYGYSAHWCKGPDGLDWYIRDCTEEHAGRVTGVEDTQNYDLALYPIPRAESVPEELRQMVDDPIFRAAELTREAVQARAYRTDEAGDSDGWRMHFSVLYGTKVVTVTAKGIDPDWLYDTLCALSAPSDAPMPDEAGNTGALTPFDEVWGGSYMDAGGNWVVLLTQDTPEHRAEVFRRNPHISQSGTQFRQADYSLAYLTRLMADISEAMGDGRLSFVSTAALCEDLNRVEVTMAEDWPDAETKVSAFDTAGGAILFRYGGQVQIQTQEIVKSPAR